MRQLVESSFYLNTKLLKKDLRKARLKESVENYLNFVQNGRSGALDYSIEYSIDGNTYLIIKLGPEEQKILLSERELTFGTRTYLTCGCGAKTNGLYLKSGYFACRKCQKLHYRSTRLNTKTDHGQMLLLHGRRLNLIDMREEISRPIYRGHYTKRFMRWLGLCTHAGIFDEVIRANSTMGAIKRFRTQKI